MSSAASSFSELPAVLQPHLSTAQIAQLHRYAVLLQEKNALVNLISRKDIAHVWGHHIVPSLLLLGWERFPAGETVLDIGTGGGLPGIPLAIAHPETFFVLIDSTRKKIDAVRAMLHELGLHTRVEARWGRVEELRERYRIIVGRAVAPLPRFLTWAQKVLAPDGQIYYYTGEPVSSPPRGWMGQFYAFREVVPGDEYLATKGILHLRRRP